METNQPAERLAFKPPWHPTIEPVAEAVWLVKGDIKHGMNVFLIEDEGGGVTQFDAGTKPMVGALQKVHGRFGGLNRIVLGHAHSDHRGSAPKLGGPTLCHPDEVGYAEAESWRDTDYWDMSELSVASVRFLYEHWLHNRWDDGAVKVTGTVSEGDEVSGFEVVHFPGHAPGLIGLWRESDRLMLCSDTVYFADSERLKPLDYPSVPHHAWSWDHDQTIASVRKLAEIDPATLAPGHDGPFTKDSWKADLLKAADAAG